MSDFPPTADQITQQNRLHFAKQKLKCKTLLSERQLSRGQIPDLVSKYEGYMQIHKRKQGEQPPTQYYTSSFLKELKEKRNNMFSDEIIDKMVKAYDLKEYGTGVDWRPIASNGVNLSNTKFATSPPQIQNYHQITVRMLKQ